ncbi:MAG: type II toxin-antitoxin system RelE/ParE family toxin [Bacteroidetes bacterium]|nr:type II toxin-antitoxin system RelE/ParE family toxin [Bacteroidota bacterium]
MPYKEVIKEEARADIAEAMSYYASKSSGLDTRFFNEVAATIKHILRNPFAFKKVYKNFRQTSVRKFPYVIFYEPEGNNVIIYSVFNTWQHPAKKISRVKK